MHDKLLDHEALCRRLDAMRRRKRSAPAGKYRYDEAVSFDDADDDGTEDSALDLSDLLRVDVPGGALQSIPRSTSDDAPCDGRQPAAESGMHDDDDEEALDQRVVASRQQIKTWVRALEKGRQQPALQGPPRRTPSTTPSASALTSLEAAAPAAKRALPPVVPPPRARQSSYSMRLRSQAVTWGARYAK